MLFIVRQVDGHEIGVHADRLEVEATGNGEFRFHGPNESSIELPARKVEYVKLVDEMCPDRHLLDEEVPEPKPAIRSG